MKASWVLFWQEIARIVYEGSADIHVDPVLHTACKKDLQVYCENVLPGMGQRKCFFFFFYYLTVYVLCGSVNRNWLKYI